ncbi:hypothetical protein F4560_008733 [Saccharothrix ecbatanensis]|uniref:Uncharacterized protein n=1 Tax=Saccharothrix ecbatanensis TaxID=1105145 RepID=A0A7W9HV13_9PSEU|nr:hypothetical protein [Saccharothrix ecbatanensis]MBB5808965.1 hypothetical protein [Saccharothrix ecbatanensis]
MSAGVKRFRPLERDRAARMALRIPAATVAGGELRRGGGLSF